MCKEGNRLNAQDFAGPMGLLAREIVRDFSREELRSRLAVANRDAAESLTSLTKNSWPQSRAVSAEYIRFKLRTSALADMGRSAPTTKSFLFVGNATCGKEEKTHITTWESILNPITVSAFDLSGSNTEQSSSHGKRDEEAIHPTPDDSSRAFYKRVEKAVNKEMGGPAVDICLIFSGIGLMYAILAWTAWQLL